MDGIKSLLKSRKVLLAVLGVLNTIVSAYFQIKPEVWASVDGLLAVLIYSIATEDAAAKSAQPPASDGGNPPAPQA